MRSSLTLTTFHGPIEFTYNRIDTPTTFLWRREDLQRHAARKLTVSLFSLCPRTPRLLLCLAKEVRGELFSRDIQVSIPVGRLAPSGETISSFRDETKDAILTDEPLQVFWFPGKPAEDSLEARLISLLAAHGLLLEPFERASQGLREVYKATPLS